MVTEHGLVKVLDFGLAKLTEASCRLDGDEPRARCGPRQKRARSSARSPTCRRSRREGKKVDARSDIFSFGSVLYEMVTGRRAFHGDTKASTLAAILRDNPRPASELSMGFPAKWRG